MAEAGKINKRLLFIGDSITDVERNRDDSHDLGKGYPAIIAQELAFSYPEYAFEVLNRGISGNRISDLNARIEADCLALQPDIVSLLVGVNDTWHNVEGETFGTEEEASRFREEYETFILALKTAGIEDIIVIEPFLLPIPTDRLTWRHDLDQKIHIVRELAHKHQLHFLHLDGLFNAYGIKDGYAEYADDGVHPTLAGHQLIASHWLSEVAPDLFNLD